jgi:hypothetical protein
LQHSCCNLRRSNNNKQQLQQFEQQQQQFQQQQQQQQQQLQQFEQQQQQQQQQFEQQQQQQQQQVPFGGVPPAAAEPRKKETWVEVKHGDGRIYYWNPESNEVRWEIPPGVKPKKLCEVCGKDKVAAKVTFREASGDILRQLCKACTVAAQNGAKLNVGGANAAQATPQRSSPQTLPNDLPSIDERIASEMRAREGLVKMMNLYASDPAARQQTEQQVQQLDATLTALHQKRAQLAGNGGGGRWRLATAVGAAAAAAAATTAAPAAIRSDSTRAAFAAQRSDGQLHESAATGTDLHAGGRVSGAHGAAATAATAAAAAGRGLAAARQ